MRIALSVAAIASASAMGLVAACESVPAIVFYGDDGGAGASTTTSTASSDAGTSGGQGGHDGGAGDATAAIVDAFADHSVSAEDAGDGAPSETCPTGPPPGTSICCGATPCRGDPDACASSCTNCENDCNPGQTCCLDTNGNFAGCSAIACP